MRIGYLNNTDRGGGAETIVRSLRDGLRCRGHETTLWVGRRRSREDPEYTHALASTESERRTAQRYALRGYFGLGVASSGRFVESSALAETDLLHLHNLHGHYFSIPTIPRLARQRPLVWTFHDLFPITGGCAFPYDCDRWMSQCRHCPQQGKYPIGTEFDHTTRMQAIKQKAFRDLPVTIISPSKHLAAAVKRSHMFGSAEFHVIPYGVDTELFHPGRQDARAKLGMGQDEPAVLLIAPRLDDPRKGVDHAVKALRQVRMPNLNVLVLGTGDSQRLVESLSPHRLRPFGYVKDRMTVADCYAAVDLVLFPSLAENFPCVVQEAMASGTAVLAYNIDGVKEQIVSDETGFLAAPGDVETLARSARELLENGPLLKQVGQSARRYACTEWSLARFLDCHEALYRELITRSG